MLRARAVRAVADEDERGPALRHPQRLGQRQTVAGGLAQPQPVASGIEVAAPGGPALLRIDLPAVLAAVHGLAALRGDLEGVRVEAPAAAQVPQEHHERGRAPAVRGFPAPPQRGLAVRRLRGGGACDGGRGGDAGQRQAFGEGVRADLGELACHGAREALLDAVDAGRQRGLDGAHAVRHLAHRLVGHGDQDRRGVGDDDERHLVTPLGRRGGRGAGTVLDGTGPGT
ncbi:hypothetical protein [Streptomyces aurantiacus]|uniref:hypothetical protein n=1 Tax=Streptomyces aurantiacus TaxID=47760 RepID=UPI001319BA05|nr:hypothetical protein [Streptomyces aurantiacus]